MSLTHWLQKKKCWAFLLPFQTFSHNDLSCVPISLKPTKSKKISLLIKINLFTYSKVVWLAIFLVVWTRTIRIIREAEKRKINILNKVGQLYDNVYWDCIETAWGLSTVTSPAKMWHFSTLDNLRQNCPDPLKPHTGVPYLDKLLLIVRCICCRVCCSVRKEKAQNLMILADLAFIQEALILSVVFSCIKSQSQNLKLVISCSLE